MLISSEKEQISLPLDNGTVSLKSSLMGSDPDSLDGLPPASELPESPPLPTIYTDVNVVPEYEKNELEQTISSLEDEIVGLKLKQRSLDEKRRHALNRILDIKGAIRVFCRIRPFLSKDGSQIHQPVSVVSEKIVVRSAGSKKEFRFDKVFPQQASQEDVFVEVEPILKSALDGNNVCIMAYGQTGTGKTYTMDGTNHQPGIVTRALKELFHRASLDTTASFTFSMSMLEVYMGNLRDLLAPKTSYKAYEEISRVNLNIQTDPKGSVEIEGLTEVQIPDFTKASWWYAKGRRVRSTSWTNVNEASSRSHCLTRITIYRRGDIKEHKMEVTKLWMIDLGGSERLLKTGATGQTLDEGRAINLSISALGDVIAALRRKRSHVPYRNSKLTQILKDSLGDGSKVLMLVHVSPCEYDIGETTCSLSFAKRASAIESNRELQEDLKMLREKRIAQLEEEMGEADEECKKVGDQIQKVEFLLIEKKQLFSATYGLVEDEILAPKNPKEDLGTPQTSGKAIRRNISSSLPRFMSPTAASRQRQSAAERVVVGRARTLTSVTISSIHFSASQSVSYSDPRFKALLRNSSNKKARYGEETKTILSESPKCSGSLDSKKQSMPLSKMVTSSNPNLRVTLSRHRRRMSDLI